MGEASLLEFVITTIANRSVLGAHISMCVVTHISTSKLPFVMTRTSTLGVITRTLNHKYPKSLILESGAMCNMQHAPSGK